MKVLFVNLPFASSCMRDFRCQGSTKTFMEQLVPPISLAYVAATIRKNNHQMKLVDCIAEEIDENGLSGIIGTYKPKMLVSVVSTPTFPSDILVVSKIKQKFPEIKICLFGTHTTIFPKDTLENKAVDFVAIREAEYTVLELIKSLEENKNLNKVLGLAYRNKGKIVINEARPLIKDLDALPFPARDMLPMKKYNCFLMRHKPFTNVLSSRGCPFSCIFCASHIMLDRQWRPRSPENIIEELKEIKKNFGVREVFFNDDCFTLKKDRVKKICELMINNKLNIIWGCESRVDTVDKELLKLMKKAGCYKIVYGIESGSQEILDNLKKGIKIKQIKDAVKWTKEAGIYSNGSFMVGTPWDTEETFKKTIDFAIDLDLDHANFLIATPMPGTEFYDLAKREKLFINENDWSNFQVCQTPVIKTKSFSTERIKELRSIAYKRFYLRPVYLIKRIPKTRSWNEFKILVKAGFSLIFSR